MNPTLKRYLVSSTVTFLAAFFLALGAQLKAGVPIDVTTTGVFAIVSVAARAGWKAVVEWTVAYFTPETA